MTIKQIERAGLKDGSEYLRRHKREFIRRYETLKKDSEIAIEALDIVLAEIVFNFDVVSLFIPYERRLGPNDDYDLSIAVYEDGLYEATKRFFEKFLSSDDVLLIRDEDMRLAGFDEGENYLFEDVAFHLDNFRDILSQYDDVDKALDKFITDLISLGFSCTGPFHSRSTIGKYRRALIDLGVDSDKDGEFEVQLANYTKGFKEACQLFIEKQYFGDDNA